MDRRTFNKLISAAALPWWLIRQPKPPIDLSPFCGDDQYKLFKYDFSSPWQAEGVSVASDSRIIGWTQDIILSSDDELQAVKRPSIGHLPMLETERLTGMKQASRMSRVRRESACPECFRSDPEECKLCQGWGCDKCDSRGCINPCNMCKGVGDVDYSYAFGGWCYSAAYAELISKLPDVAIGQVSAAQMARRLRARNVTTTIDGTEQLLAFRAYNGRLHGLLMPMTQTRSAMRKRS